VDVRIAKGTNGVPALVVCDRQHNVRASGHFSSPVFFG
jgi:hypothetical protein